MRAWIAAFGALLLSAAWAAAFSRPAAADAPAGPAATDMIRQPLECILSGDATCPLGQAPKLRAAIKNCTDGEIQLVGCLDASSCRWRYPHCYFEVLGPDGESAVRPTGRCGNMSSLHERCFVAVPRGESFDPFQKRADGMAFSYPHQGAARNFEKLGKYRIRLVYSTDCTDLEKWRGDRREDRPASDAVVGLFSLVPKVEVRSDFFEVTVVPAAN